MERILAQNLSVRRDDRGRLYRLILYIIWESHPRQGEAKLTRGSIPAAVLRLWFAPVLISSAVTIRCGISRSLSVHPSRPSITAIHLRSVQDFEHQFIVDK
jgi:hypothetical protein